MTFIEKDYWAKNMSFASLYDILLYLCSPPASTHSYTFSEFARQKVE